MIDHVLSKFRRDEMPFVQDSVSIAADAVETILGDGTDTAMNRFNSLKPNDCILDK
jgi:peptidyl-tRNA hydrolase